ncbi:MAG: DUF305 domain-containing protein [Patescibacteria group bacterium]
MKNNTYRLVTLVTLIIVLLGGYFFVRSESYNYLKARLNFAKDSAESVSKLVDNATTSDDHDKGMPIGISERVFLEQMIPHHQESVTAAKSVLAQSENIEVKALAKDISQAEEKEVVAMKIWYQSWYGVEYSDAGTYKPTMSELPQLSGVTLDKAFLEAMIQHHMTTLTTIQTVVPNIEHDEIKLLATGSAEKQSAEIITMRILLKGL